MTTVHQNTKHVVLLSKVTAVWSQCVLDLLNPYSANGYVLKGGSDKIGEKWDFQHFRLTKKYWARTDGASQL